MIPHHHPHNERIDLIQQGALVVILGALAVGFFLAQRQYIKDSYTHESAERSVLDRAVEEPVVTEKKVEMSMTVPKLVQP